MTSSIAAAMVSRSLLRICVCSWGVVANTDTRVLLCSASAAVVLWFGLFVAGYTRWVSRR
jgi:hypothetical protein